MEAQILTFQIQREKGRQRKEKSRTRKKLETLCFPETGKLRQTKMKWIIIPLKQVVIVK